MLDQSFMHELLTLSIVSVDINGQALLFPFTHLYYDFFQYRQVHLLGLVYPTLPRTLSMGVNFGPNQTLHQVFIINQKSEILGVVEEIVIFLLTFNGGLPLDQGVVLSQ